MPDGLCWPVLRLVNAGHDYALILKSWTLPMVIRANMALDIQEEANQLAAEKSQPQKNGGLVNEFWGNT